MSNAKKRVLNIGTVHFTMENLNQELLERRIKMFEPNPLPPFDLECSQPRCLCGTPEEYEDFLIGEYGAEKVLEVKREEERIQKSFNNMSDDTKLMALFCLFLDCVAAR